MAANEVTPRPARPGSTPLSRRTLLGGLLGAAGLVTVGGVACGTSGSGSGAAAARTVRLNFGVISSSSSHYLHYVAKAKVINENVPSVNVTVVAAGSPTENVPRMAAGEFDMTNFSPSTGYEQYKGLNAFRGKAIPELRIWFNDVDFGNAFLVRDDSGVSTLDDLDGKPYNPGIPGSSADTQTREVLSALGITPRYQPSSLDDAVEAVRNRDVVGYTKATGVGGRPDSSTLELESQVGLTALSFAPEQVDTIKARFPMLTTVTVPASVNLDIYPADSTVLGAGLGQAVMADLDADLVYDMTEAIFAHRDEINRAFPGYGSYDLAEQTLKYATIPLHRATVRFFKDRGVTVPDELVPPEYEG